MTRKHINMWKQTPIMKTPTVEKYCTHNINEIHFSTNVYSFITWSGIAKKMKNCHKIAFSDYWFKNKQL